MDCALLESVHKGNGGRGGGPRLLFSRQAFPSRRLAPAGAATTTIYHDVGLAQSLAESASLPMDV
ncbi:hypothetical protein BD413DRAFT_564260, partial [Trametes elegans]